MPRIRQNQAEYARNDFQRAIRRAQVDADIMEKKSLAEAAGIPYSTLWKRLEAPENMSMGEFQKLLKVLPIPAEAVLAYLGYSTKEINKLAKENAV